MPDKSMYVRSFIAEHDLQSGDPPATLAARVPSIPLGPEVPLPIEPCFSTYPASVAVQ